MVTREKKAKSAQRRADNRARAEARGYERVRARPILPNTRVKITRRCSERRLFLGPDRSPEEIANFYGYTLGRALPKYQVEFNGACQLGNHHHADLNHLLANRPKFKSSVHSCLARGINARNGRFGGFWERGSSCDTVTDTDEETLADLVYTETNPVKDGLVKWGSRWPWFTSYGWRFGETRTFKRPDWFYDPKNPDNPPEVHITRVRPPIFPHLSDDELFELLMERNQEQERKFQAERRRQGRRFMGEKKLLRQRWGEPAKTPEDKFKVEPKVGSSNRWRRLAQLQRNRHWEEEYATARKERLAGGDPVFPAGTYQLLHRAGVKVAELSPEAPP